MKTPEERAVIAEISDRLIDLYVKRDEACIQSDLARAHSIQEQIETVREERRLAIQSTE